MKDTYFSITASEDGLKIEKISDMNEFLKVAIEERKEFLNDFPIDNWSKKTDIIYRENYPNENEIILIKGTIVKPTIKKVVTEYEI